MFAKDNKCELCKICVEVEELDLFQPSSRHIFGPKPAQSKFLRSNPHAFSTSDSPILCTNSSELVA
jgi:hypothetical protein